MTAQAPTPQPFEPTGDLPTGVRVLQASAGTGKTYTIEGLVARYVAVEDIALPRLLVVTFTRAATAELRDRVRTRLLRTADHLHRVLGADTAAGAAGPDRVAALLAAGTPAEVSERLARLRRALADFDAATISTIHGFCRNVLGTLGLTGDADRSAVLIEDERDLVESVVDDLLVRRFHRDTGDGLALARRDALRIASTVVGNPDAAILPVDPADPQSALRVRFAHRVAAEVDRRKRAGGVLSFNDVLGRLAGTLSAGDADARAARRRLRQQFQVVLVDEFQDTDPTQWDIVREAFGGGDRPLVLIGDPKQAIYSFRGADVFAYLRAARSDPEPETLATNWRSDGGLLTAFNALFLDARLGHDEIHYDAVSAPAAHQRARITGAPDTAPLQLRVVRRDRGLPISGGGKNPTVQADAAREAIARDLAAHAVALLGSGAQLIDRDAAGGEQSRTVGPPHLAVLVRRNVDAALVQRHLLAAGVPAVINGVGSVFGTEAALDWLTLLLALERPSSPSRVRAAVLTTFVGWTADRLAGADDAEWDGMHQRLHRWAAVLRDRSVASLWATLGVEEQVPARLLDAAGGERTLTDLAHLAELLHAAAGAEALGVTALAAWLREQVVLADDAIQPEDRARRLESDADAVQVMTVHRSKGLEFPVVYCPYLWTSGYLDRTVPVFHPLDSWKRTVDVGGPTSGGYEESVERAERENRDEDLRLLYVALTRARHQAVVWWAPGGGARTSPLARMLFCRDLDGGPVNTNGTPSLPGDDQTLDRLGRLAARGAGTIAVAEVAASPSAARWAGRPPTSADLDVAAFDRGLDRSWRRTSYTGITRDAPHPGVGSEPGEPMATDEHLPPAPAARGGDGEPDGGGTDGGRSDGGRSDGGKTAGGETAGGETAGGETAGGGTDEGALRAAASPLAGVGGGVAFGTFVHAVLENVDFAADDITAVLRGEVERQLRRRPLDVGDRDAFAAALRGVLDTPLGPDFGEVALREVHRGDRLDELEFELPLVGGRDPSGQVSVADFAAVLRRHVPGNDPLAGYADRLDDPALHGALRGYLTGSIDAVVRLHTDDGPRFAVVDYKTNWLGVGDEPLSAWHYRPAAMAAAMARAHYPLQALLYAVALHRYLRWRLAGYDPGRHLGGIAYLFVRGMSGGDVPRVDGRPCGVFAWQPPAGLVTGLSDLLGRGRGPS